jgi:hypothetical protein
MEIRNIKEADFLDCVNIVKKSWPEFKERESIYLTFHPNSHLVVVCHNSEGSSFESFPHTSQKSLLAAVRIKNQESAF